MRKILLILTLVVALVLSFALFITGPPALALVPPVIVAAACSLVKLSVIKLTEEKSQTPKVLCGVPASFIALYSLFGIPLFELKRSVFKIPITIYMSLASLATDSFRYAFATGSRFLTTRLNL